MAAIRGRSRAGMQLQFAITETDGDGERISSRKNFDFMTIGELFLQKLVAKVLINIWLLNTPLAHQFLSFVGSQTDLFKRDC